MDDVRWLQRFTNLKRAFRNLEEGLSVTNPSKLERQGIIKAFELCYELAWKTLQDYLRDLGFQQVVGPKAVIRTAFREGLISDGTSWADLHAARNASTHLYDEETALSLEKDIRANYRHLFTTLVAELDARSPATDTKAPQLSRLTAQTGLPSNALAAIRQVVCNDPSVESVNKVVLFGSRAKGTWRSGSDIDLAVFGTGLTFQDTARWKDLLEERLFPWTVDVIAPSLVHDSAVLDHIERVGIVLWSS